MIKYENGCVDCGLPCMGSSCPYKRVPVKICDQCKCEVDELYWYEGEQLCKDCAIERFEESLEEVMEDE